jgi:hypothetical protein
VERRVRKLLAERGGSGQRDNPESSAVIASARKRRHSSVEEELTMRRRSLVLLSFLLSTSCSKTSASPAEAKATEKEAEAPALGEIMVQVARRFELAGRAASANRFELAAFEAGELGELFENEVPRASLPKEGPTAQIHALAKAFREAIPPELTRAAAANDRAAFAAAFQHAAAMCNACHASAAKGFIQIPSVPGQSVPVLDPLPPPSGSSR